MVSRPLVSMAERVRKPWLELVSRKITARYSGWMLGFMAAWSRTKARIIQVFFSQATLSLQSQVAVDERDRQPLGLDVESDRAGVLDAPEDAAAALQIVGGGGVGDCALEGVHAGDEGTRDD